MPLVIPGDDTETPPPSEAAERARKIRPEFTRGELVRVAGGRNEAEAELISNLLLEEGIPSLVRRSPGADVPEFLAAGPRDVLVPESGADTARNLLHEAELLPAGVEPYRPNAAKLFAVVLGGGALTTLVAWLLIELVG
jgi:hypothetical protein